MYCLNISTMRRVIGKRKQLLRIAERALSLRLHAMYNSLSIDRSRYYSFRHMWDSYSKETLPKTLTGRPSSFLHLLPLRRMALCLLENYSYFIVGRRHDGIKRRKPFAQDARARERSLEAREGEDTRCRCRITLAK